MERGRELRSPDLEQTRFVSASGNTTAALRIHGHKILGLQVSKPRNAAQIGFDAAIRTTIDDGRAKIGVASLHGDEAALFVTTQIANVVGNGWNVFGALGTRHVSDGHFIG